MSIGFCFLVGDDINHVDLWERYFKNAGERAKIFVHRAKTWDNQGTQKMVKRCAIEGKHCLCPGGDVYFVDDNGKNVLLSDIAKPTALKENVEVSIPCTVRAFGGDPSWGVKKSCFCDISPDQPMAQPQTETDKDNQKISALVRDHLIPVGEHVYTKWGDISLVRATKVLFKNCYQSGAVKCVLLSESDVPVRPFNEAYAYLTAHNKTHLDYARVPAVTSNERWTQVMMLERFVNNIKRSADFAYHIDVRHFTYHSMWMALNREHVKVFVDDSIIFGRFDTAFVPDENYVFYLLSYHGLLDEVVKESITFVNWAEPVQKPGGGQSPKTYHQCSSKELRALTKYKEYLFARKFAADSNIAEVLADWWANPQRVMPISRPPDLLPKPVKPIRETGRQIADLRKAVGELQNQLALARSVNDTQASDNFLLVEESLAQERELEARVADIRGTRGKFEAKVVDLEARNQQLEENLRQARARISANGTQVSDNGMLMESLGREQRLKARLADLDRNLEIKVSGLEAQKKKLEETLLRIPDVQKLESQYQQNNEQVNGLQEQIKLLKMRSVDMAVKLQMPLRKVSELSEVVARLKSRNLQLVSDLVKPQERITVLEDTVSSLKFENSQLLSQQEKREADSAVKTNAVKSNLAFADLSITVISFFIVVLILLKLGGCMRGRKGRKHLSPRSTV